MGRSLELQVRDDFGFSDDLHQHAHDHMIPETQNHYDSL